MTDAFRAARRTRLHLGLAAVVLTMFFLEPSVRVNAGQGGANDLDSLMAKVLARRKVDQEALKDYILNDVEQIEVTGPGDFTMFRGKREYVWYVRDGLHVRSPVRFNGVAIGKAERKEYEDKWIKEEQEREKKRVESEANSRKAVPDEAAADQASPDPGKSLITQIAEPRFISEAYFLDFKFESGNYYLVGREKLDGRDVLVIEYYPTNLFRDKERQANSGNQERDQKPQAPGKEDRDKDALINRQMNKTSLVTLWIDPAEFQIVKYTFSNIWMDFLPAGWMVRVDHLKASMEMSQPVPGVWLPRSMSIQAGLSLAVGLYTVGYDRRFSDYKRAEVTTTIRPIDPEQQ